jgi:hypothetical protein
MSCLSDCCIFIPKSENADANVAVVVVDSDATVPKNEIADDGDLDATLPKSGIVKDNATIIESKDFKLIFNDLPKKKNNSCLNSECCYCQSFPCPCSRSLVCLCMFLDSF